ncbi:WD-repeat-containing protein [Exidia glandulosa HHB12029]|uniref:WD-repeat-containing protein n=1 Tax=Exidia glandulosa HHB12029 TaxID=1314781 RepID=A0A165QVI1_EXIGL|nr:WD-repeat-containing protein [Exidia glandulosa HHB12029]
MVKSYLRHGPTQAFGLICSAGANSAFDGKLAYVPALEDVLVWDIKKGQMMAMWHETGHRAEVTCIRRAPQASTFAVGYADGSIRLWDAATGTVSHVFNGHKKAVTALAFDPSGTRLASGSQDTDLILWDVVGERGICRLRGHRDQITGVSFIPAPSQTSSSSTSAASASWIVTTAKDTYLKLWDLNTQHCVQTIVAHRTEVWTLDLNNDANLILTGSNEGELKAWRVDHDALATGLHETESGEPVKFIHPAGDLSLSSRQRVSQILFHPSEAYLAVQSHDKSVEIFRIRTHDDIQKKRARRKKRAKEKHQNGESAIAVDEEDGTVTPAEMFAPYLVVRASGKVRSFCFSPSNKLQLFVALSSNALEVYNIPPPTKSKSDVPEATRSLSLDLPGHRTDIRTLCLSYNDQLLASASNGSLKIWNVKTTACIRTLDCGYAICSTFLPGDRQIAVGTKSGEIMIYDIASSSLASTIKAHDGAVWAMHIRPDGGALVTGSADKTVKFWDIKGKVDRETRTSSVELEHTSSLQMPDDVLAVKYSPNGKLIAVSLLDSTVKIFYQDTLKFFLSLYGHKLPVLALDISDDSKLIVTCSADKNVKIWGLDFGDCHKSIFAHDESIMQVAFEKKSHLFWTVSKDRMLKYWDGDKFEQIQRLEGHHGEVWALAVSHHSDFVVTGSHDKSIRIWEKLEDPLFLEEEREREMESMYDAAAVDNMNKDSAAAEGQEVTEVSKQTSETLMAGERIINALDVADKDLEDIRDFEEAKARLSAAAADRLPPPTRNPILSHGDLSAEAYVLQEVERIPPANLLDALLVLPFDKVISLMKYLDAWAKKDWNIPLVSRTMLMLLKLHHHQIVANRVLRTSLLPLRTNLRKALLRQKQAIGYNLAALNHIRRVNDAQRTAQFFDMDETAVRAKIAEGRKRKRVSVKA